LDYVVQPGDSLWRIAARFFGDGAKWPAIAEDNRLRQVDLVLVGQRLTVRDSLVVVRAPAAARLPLSVPGAPPPHGPSVVPARAFLFVLADEINPLRSKVVRKVMVSAALAEQYSRQIGRAVAVVPHPERFGLHPGDPGSPLSLARHAQGMKPSAFQSVSTKPLGTSRMVGKRFWVDVEKAKAAGATFHTTDEIVADLDRIARKMRKPADLAKVEYYKGLVQADAEQLVRGSIPPAAIKGAAAMALTRGLQVVQVTGFVMTAVDLGQAGFKSVEQNSVKPLAAETIRQAGGWGAAWAGAKIGGMAGAALGIETGPGAVVTGAVGAIVGGTAGYLGFDWIADHLDEN
jgi:hypothetical protein